MKPSEEKEALLSPEECFHAYDDAYDKPVNFDHKPTPEEIFNIQLQAVARAQLAKLERLGY